MATQTLPVQRNITVYQGATYRAHYRWKPNGVVQDFTVPAPWTARMQIRRRAGQPAVLDLSTENGGITLDAGGNIEIYASAAETGAIPRASSYQWDIELYQPNSGDVLRFMMGAASLSQEITA